MYDVCWSNVAVRDVIRNVYVHVSAACILYSFTFSTSRQVHANHVNTCNNYEADHNKSA